MATLRPCSLKANCTRLFWCSHLTWNYSLDGDLKMCNGILPANGRWSCIRKHAQNLECMLFFNMPTNRAEPQLLRLVCDWLHPGSFDFCGHLSYKPPVDHGALVLSDLHPILLGPSHFVGLINRIDHALRDQRKEITFLKPFLSILIQFRVAME